MLKIAVSAVITIDREIIATFRFAEIIVASSMVPFCAVP
jgi:hypothetical protein